MGLRRRRNCTLAEEKIAASSSWREGGTCAQIVASRIEQIKMATNSVHTSSMRQTQSLSSRMKFISICVLVLVHVVDIVFAQSTLRSAGRASMTSRSRDFVSKIASRDAAPTLMSRYYYGQRYCRIEDERELETIRLMESADMASRGYLRSYATVAEAATDLPILANFLTAVNLSSEREEFLGSST